MITSKTVRRLAIEAAIGFLLVLGITGLAVYSARVRRVDHSAFRWFGLALTTAVTFAYLADASRALWSGKKFWLIFGGLFSLHIVAFILILAVVDSWPLALFFPIMLVEMRVGRVLLEKYAKPSLG